MFRQENKMKAIDCSVNPKIKGGKMLKRLLLIIFLISPAWVYGQNLNAGLELQAYPAGVIPGLTLDYEITESQFLHLRVGYNYTDRGSWGEHDQEDGGGLGFSLGYRFRELFGTKFTADLRSDLWFMNIDWQDERLICGTVPPCNEVLAEGNTDITVLQPTAGIGYPLRLSSGVVLTPTLSFGREINIRTDGEQVGEDFIGLIGLRLGFE